jgi:hypothetical protein
VVCEPVDTPPEPALDPAPAPGPEPETPRSRGRPKGAPNKAKEPKPLPPAIEVVEVDEPVEPVRERQKKEKAVPKAPKAMSKAAPKPKVQRDASPAPFEPTFEELLGHMGRAMAQQRAVRAQGRSDLYSQFLS